MPNTIPYVPWKRYTFAVSQAILVFTIASFLLAYFIMHTHPSTLTIVLAVMTYLTIIIFSVYQMVKQFSMAAVMLMIPIAPLVILIIVLSLIHLLQVM